MMNEVFPSQIKEEVDVKGGKESRKIFSIPEFQGVLL